ncbi:hypothetical protein D6779_07215 [Candidatus Parcubacteria bacterium]|nr:MAG: hypothetical protein D6779_07215 [Candidatus Parcubacteria bacterium]
MFRSANWVRESISAYDPATTTFTLGGAPAGYVPFSAVANDGDTIGYVIADGNDREIGLGKYTASTNTIQSIRVVEKFQNGTRVVDGTGLGAYSASAQIFIGDAAGNKVLQVGIGRSGLQFSKFYAGATQLANVAPTANTIYFTPFAPRTRIGSFSTVAIRSNNAMVNTAIEFGFYSVGADGNPENLISSTTLSNIINSTGLLTYTLNTPVVFTSEHDWLWLAVHINNTSSPGSFTGVVPANVATGSYHAHILPGNHPLAYGGNSDDEVTGLLSTGMISLPATINTTFLSLNTGSTLIAMVG